MTDTGAHLPYPFYTIDRAYSTQARSCFIVPRWSSGQWTAELCCSRSATPEVPVAAQPPRVLHGDTLCHPSCDEAVQAGRKDRGARLSTAPLSGGKALHALARGAGDVPVRLLPCPPYVARSRAQSSSSRSGCERNALGMRSSAVTTGRQQEAHLVGFGSSTSRKASGTLP